MTVFDVFREIDYTFQEISRGQVVGNVVTKERQLRGIFKLRENQETTNNMELFQSNATLHAHPEDFSDWNYADLVGQGVFVNDIPYEITNVTAGTNFDNGRVEHLTFTLQDSSISYGN